MDTHHSRPFYLLSLYYRDDVFSGANKRFANLASNLQTLLGDRLKLIISAGENPDFVPATNHFTVPAYSSAAGRIQAFWHLRKLLTRLPAGSIISDFMPIPFAALSRHRPYQLIHDLRNFTEFRRGGLAFMSAAFQKRQLRKSRALVTVSEDSRSDIMDKCGISADRILVSYNGVSDKYVQSKVTPDKHYDLLYVGHFEARKNHVALLQAVRRAARPLRICLVGARFDTYELVKSMASQLESERGFSIDIHEQVEEDALIDLYRKSKVYVCPSLLEGFGMPLIEAMATGCHVVCSDIPVFREICGEGARYFDARDPASIWLELAAALSDPHANAHPPELNKFAWPNIAKKLLEDIENFEARHDSEEASR